MEFSFTPYKPHRETRKKPVEPLVETRANGRIIFNKPASALVQDKPYCMLAYDKDNKAIGIQPIDEQKLNSFVIQHTAKGAYIGAKKFLRDIGLLPTVNVSQTPIQAGEYIAVKL